MIVPIQDRLMDAVEFDPFGGCWLWSRATTTKGRGQVWINGAVRRASRVFYERFVGPIHSDLHVLHKCDVPQCVNPAHLFLGTHADNMADMVQKGRSLAGEKSLRTSLTRDQAREIISAVMDGAKPTDLRRRFGLKKSASVFIASRRRWNTVWIELEAEKAKQGGIGIARAKLNDAVNVVLKLEGASK